MGDADADKLARDTSAGPTGAAGKNGGASLSTPVAATVTAVLVAAALIARLYLRSSLVPPIGFAAPIAIIALFGRRRFVWAATAIFMVGTAIRFFAPGLIENLTLWQKTGDCALADFNLLLVAIVCDRWIASQASAKRRAADLELANQELINREEEIARQNGELQSQTEELERKHEELSVSNEELARRERTLEVLLSLSRSLTVQESRMEMMQLVCDSLPVLLERPGKAAAICEREGEFLVVRCHAGFGPEGIENGRVPLNETFASLILARGQTGYLEDLATRPDLRAPRPKAGSPMASILAAPLRIGGAAVGTLEIYSRQPTAWSETQISMIESLAAQASVSLEAGYLFETASAERQRFGAVLRTAPVGIAVVSADGKDIRLNPAGATMFGCSADENVLAGRTAPPWVLLHDGVPLAYEQSPLARALAGREVPAEEIEIAVGARRMVVLKNARPIRSQTGQVTGAVAAFTDITPLKELERELDARRREAEENSVRKTHFLAAVSHDIRTPANAINLLAELIARSWAVPALSAEIPDLTRELKNSAASLVELLNDVLDLARYDAGKIELQIGEFDVGELVEEQVQNLRRVATAKDLPLDCDVSRSVDTDRSMRITSDRMKLARVLANLIGNAIKFTEHGKVMVGAHSAGDAVAVSVSDTGIGIAPEMQQHIFEEFVQLRNPERDRNKGTGLGLSICRRLVLAMGGTLSVASVPGQGSTFTVVLPKQLPISNANAPASSSSPGPAC
jgi:PAS domain S-box-containing protein